MPSQALHSDLRMFIPASSLCPCHSSSSGPKPGHLHRMFLLTPNLCHGASSSDTIHWVPDISRPVRALHTHDLVSSSPRPWQTVFSLFYRGSLERFLTLCPRMKTKDWDSYPGPPFILCYCSSPNQLFILNTRHHLKWSAIFVCVYLHYPGQIVGEVCSFLSI